MIRVRINGKPLETEDIKSVEIMVSDYGEGTIIEQERDIEYQAIRIGVADRDHVVKTLRRDLEAAFERVLG